MDYSTERSESSLNGVLPLVGTWDADLSGIDGGEGMELYFILDEDGRGTTYLNGEAVHTFSAFAYDNNGSDDTQSGIYVALDDIENEPEWSRYIISDDGSTLTFTDTAGNTLISYVRR